MKPTVVIVDADPQSRQRLKGLLSQVPIVKIAGEAGDSEAAVQVLDELHPDIVFLDIEMPSEYGLDVLRRVGSSSIVIFTTATDPYALTAFELSVAGCLRKPVDADRLRAALDRAVRMAGDSSVPQTGRGYAQAGSGAQESLTRLFLRERDAIMPVRVERISRFEADGDYVVVHMDEGEHLVRLRLQDLEDQLDDRFLRVHRSHLVNLDHVRVFEPHEDGRLVVVMSDMTRILASRTRSRELRRLAR